MNMNKKYGIVIGLGSFGQVKVSSEYLPAIYDTKEQAETIRQQKIAENHIDFTRCSAIYCQFKDSEGINTIQHVY